MRKKIKIFEILFLIAFGIIILEDILKYLGYTNLIGNKNIFIRLPAILIGVGLHYLYEVFKIKTLRIEPTKRYYMVVYYCGEDIASRAVGNYWFSTTKEYAPSIQEVLYNLQEKYKRDKSKFVITNIIEFNKEDYDNFFIKKYDSNSSKTQG